MNEKTKNILSWVLSILFVGGIITSLVIEPRISLAVIGYIALGAFALLILSYMVSCLKELLYDFFSSSYFEKIYRKYISKHYESRRQVFYERGNEICPKCDADCKLKRPYRRYEEDSYCKKRVDIYIEEHRLKVDEDF